MNMIKSTPNMHPVMSQKRMNDCSEASLVIEDMLYELVPSLDKSTAKRAARKLASFQALQSLNRSTGKECAKLRLKKLSRKLLEVAKERREAVSSDTTKDSLASTKDAEMITPEVTKPPVDPIQAKVDRHHILINTVGEEKYNSILSVTEEIKQIRHSSALWTKFSHQHSILTYSIDEEEDRLPASETLPAPIADIYFRTPLLNVMGVVDARSRLPLDELPEPCSCVVQQSDWDTLLSDAQTKLAAFRKFESENVKKGEKLSFRCEGGLCSFR